jgi:hypothetical protein
MLTPMSTDSDIEQALIAGRKIQAVKIYRGATGASLTQARDVILEREAELRRQNKIPKPRTSPVLIVSLFFLLLFLSLTYINSSFGHLHFGH